MMKNRILELLEFPRELVRGDMDLEECPHQGLYDLHDKICLECDQGEECDWLYGNDEFAALELHDQAQLLKALGFGLCYVRAAIAQWNHNIHVCQCTACSWFKQAQKTYDEALSGDEANYAGLNHHKVSNTG